MKRLILSIGVMAAIAGGILLLAPGQGSNGVSQQAPQNTNSQEQGFFEPSEQLTQSIIAQTLGARFNAQTATHTTANLDNQGGQELIIGALENTENLAERPVAATIQVVAVKNPQGEYERVGQVEYQEWMRGVPEVKELKDITGDGNPEIIASLQYGGASSWAEGILTVDFAKKHVGWALIQKVEEGGDPGLGPAIFTLAASAAHQNTFEIGDLDNDGNKEIVEIFTQTILDKTECTAEVYEWNGNLFAYSEQLSEQALATLSPTCEL